MDKQQRKSDSYIGEVGRLAAAGREGDLIEFIIDLCTDEHVGEREAEEFDIASLECVAHGCVKSCNYHKASSQLKILRKKRVDSSHGHAAGLLRT